jgi:hypothetical protein
MTDFRINVENKFEEGRRRIVVHNSSDAGDTVIHWPVDGEPPQSSEFNIPPVTTDGDPENFILITVLPGVSNPGPCRIKLPAQGQITFTPSQGTEITTRPTTNGLALVFPGGAPDFPLKITRPPEGIIFTQDPDNVTVGDDGEGG